MKWIKVSEQLPEENIRMIIALTSCCQFPHILVRDHSYKCRCTDSAYCSNIDAPWVFLRDDSGFHYKSDEAQFTYWMSLPELPISS